MDSNLWYKHPILLMIEQIKKFNRKITEKKIKIILMIKYIKRLKKEEKKKSYKQSNDEY